MSQFLLFVPVPAVLLHDLKSHSFPRQLWRRNVFYYVFFFTIRFYKNMHNYHPLLFGFFTAIKVIFSAELLQAETYGGFVLWFVWTYRHVGVEAHPEPATTVNISVSFAVSLMVVNHKIIVQSSDDDISKNKTSVFCNQNPFLDNRTHVSSSVGEKKSNK